MEKTRRLEVRLSPVQYEVLEREARQMGVSMGRLVREALVEKYGDQRTGRMEALQRLISIEAPVTDWEQMKREIEGGYLSDLGIETDTAQDEVVKP